MAQFWQAFCFLLGAIVSLSFGHHPQTYGQMEHRNQDLETGLHCLVSQSPSTWSKQLIWIDYSHSSLQCSSSGLSPFHCVYSYQPPLFSSLEEEAIVASAVKLREFNEQGDNWIKEVHSHMQEARGANKNVLPSDSIEVASIGTGLEVSSLEHFTFIELQKILLSISQL